MKAVARVFDYNVAQPNKPKRPDDPLKLLRVFREQGG
jgi:hypothetical protein